jgi:hypothetical protein
MKLLEVRTALRRATKWDLFTGNVNDMQSKQGIKDNVCVFYLHQKTKQLSGPHTIYSYLDFRDVYERMAFGLVGIITPMPNEITNEFLFDLVLREASIDDVKDTLRHIKLNQIHFIYDNRVLTGPFYIDNSTTSLYLENLIARKQLFVPNERQHFKKKELKKTA